MTSIEKSRKSYQDIIGSFKNIHDKLEEWHKQRKKSVDKSYTALVQQHTAKFDTRNETQYDLEEEKDEFLYEFEKEDTRDQKYQESNTPSSSHKYRRNLSFAPELIDIETDKENIGSNMNNTSEIAMSNLKLPLSKYFP